MIQNKTKKEFKVLLIYPNLSMLLTPPLSMAIFTSLLRNAGYCVDLFDTTPYIGEGTSSVDENVSVGEEMNTLRKKHLEIAHKLISKIKSKCYLIPGNHDNRHKTFSSMHSVQYCTF